MSELIVVGIDGSAVAGQPVWGLVAIVLTTAVTVVARLVSVARLGRSDLMPGGTDLSQDRTSGRT